MISDSVDQQLYNDTKLDQFGQVLKSAMLVYLSVELPYSVIGKVYTHSIQGVTSYAKAYFVSNYQTVCTIRECYVCQP